MRIFVTAASGVIGVRLVPLLVADARMHVDDAARQTMPSLEVPRGVTIVVDDRGARS
jgi:hypothetical protein